MFLSDRKSVSGRWFPTALALLASLTALTTPAFVPAARAQTFNWKNVNIQGMGFVTGIITQPNSPYDLYIRTDVGGAYRFDRSTNQWLPLMDRYGLQPGGGLNVDSIAIDPSNSNRVYACVRATREYGVVFKGEVLLSNDKGVSWTATGMAGLNIVNAPNGDWRGWCGERLMVDPNKSGLVYYASMRNGLWRKDNGGAWTRLNGGLPDPTTLPGFYNGSDSGQLDNHPGFTFVAFDKGTGTAGNPTQTVYVGVYGSGVWRSTNGGNNWSNLGGASNPVRGTVASDGTLYVSFGSNDPNASGSVRKYRSGAWTDITPLSSSSRDYRSYQGITVQPGSPNTVMVTRGTDKIIYRSTNGGANWSQISLNVSGQPAYYPAPTARNYYTQPGNWGSTTLLIDPASVNRVWQTNGYGVIKTDNVTASPSSWTWVMNNLEELVVNAVKCPPVSGGADLLSAVHDMVGFRHVSRNSVPAATFTPIDFVAQASHVEYSGNNPQYSAWVGFPQDGSTPVFTGFSSNNGQTWTPFANTSPGQGGKIALSASNPQNMVWAPAEWRKIVYTTNGGASWQNCRKPDYDADNGYDLPISWHLSVKEWNGQVLAADRKEGGRFYYYAWNEFWISTDGGANWTRGQNGYSTTPQMPAYAIQTNIVPNPAVARDLFLSFVPNDLEAPNKLYRSTNGGLNFSVVGSVDSANFVAFGLGDSPTVPYIYIHGRVGGATEDGIYRSKDNGVTWQRISDPTKNQFIGISSLEGDMRVKDRVYAGTSGRGILVGEASSTPSDGARYHFESGTQGFVQAPWSSGISSVGTSAVQKYAGNQSLAVGINRSNGGLSEVHTNLPNPMPAAGNTITFRVWIPSGHNLKSVTCWIKENSSGNWRWTGTGRSASQLTAGTWNTITVTAPSNAAPFQEIGVGFETNGAWSGTCYIDSINW